jgi:hypothetical protein
MDREQQRVRARQVTTSATTSAWLALTASVLGLVTLTSGCDAHPRSQVDVTFFARESCVPEDRCPPGTGPKPPRVVITGPDGDKKTWAPLDGVPFVHGEARVTVHTREFNPFCYSNASNYQNDAFTENVNQNISTYGGKPATADFALAQSHVIANPELELLTKITDTTASLGHALQYLSSLCSSTASSDLETQREIASEFATCRHFVISFDSATHKLSCEPRQPLFDIRAQLLGMIAHDSKPSTSEAPDGGSGSTGPGPGGPEDTSKPLKNHDLRPGPDEAADKNHAARPDAVPTGPSRDGADALVAAVLQKPVTKDDEESAWQSYQDLDAETVRIILLNATTLVVDTAGLADPPQWFDMNRTVTITSSKTALLDGLAPPKAASPPPSTKTTVTTANKPAAPVALGGAAESGTQSIAIGTATFHTESPLFIDIGIGPAYMFDRVRAWSVVTPPGAGAGTPGVVEQTTSQPNFDAMISVSPYIWGSRWASDSLRWLKCSTCLPRPVLGFSAKAIVSALYRGMQLDPIQFIDISGGFYIYSRQSLIPGVSTGSAIEGSTVPTQTVPRASFFVAITSSLNLFTSWLSSVVKSP